MEIEYQESAELCEELASQETPEAETSEAETTEPPELAEDSDSQDRPRLALIDDIEARQNEVLKQLKDLNDRVESALNDFVRSKQPADAEDEADDDAGEPLRRAA